MAHLQEACQTLHLQPDDAFLARAEALYALVCECANAGGAAGEAPGAGDDEEDGRGTHWLPDARPVAIIGPPGAGKSALLRVVAKVSSLGPIAHGLKSSARI